MVPRDLSGIITVLSYYLASFENETIDISCAHHCVSVFSVTVLLLVSAFLFIKWSFSHSPLREARLIFAVSLST
jgi:hypothetical protein